MRHKKSGRKLNRNSSHRKCMFNNMISSLITYEIIKTTIYKAKELRSIFESIITKVMKKKKNFLNFLFFYIKNKNIIYKLVNDLIPRFINFSKGGYIKILKCGFRNGDKAPMAYIKILKKK